MMHLGLILSRWYFIKIAAISYLKMVFMYDDGDDDTPKNNQ